MATNKQTKVSCTELVSEWNAYLKSRKTAPESVTVADLAGLQGFIKKTEDRSLQILLFALDNWGTFYITATNGRPVKIPTLRFLYENVPTLLTMYKAK